MVVGATAEGKKELVALADGFRESAQSWKAVLKDASSTFHDFPAEQPIHLRTTSPIEPTFATVRLRTDKTRGCVSRPSILSMVFKLVRSAECRWRALRGSELIAKVITDVQFNRNFPLALFF